MERRLYLAFSFFLLFFILVIGKLFFWQVLSFDHLEGLAENQRSVKLLIPAIRGNIFTSDLNPIVINQKAYGIYIEPYKMENKEKILEILSRELNIDEASISAKLSNKNLVWVPISHKVNEDTVNKIKSYNLKGLDYLEESKRYYPEASMAAQLLGFLGQNSQGQDEGYFGLEGFYNEQLKGRDGYVRQEIDASGNPILTGTLDKIPSVTGRDLILHLDRTIQYIVEKKLRDGVIKYQAKGGNIIVMDPFSGGVLASVSFPSYDPGNYRSYPTETYKNSIVTESYEPGSTFKTLVMAMGLNEKKIKADTVFNESGPVEIGGYTIRTWDDKYNGMINMTDVLVHSSNVGMVYIEKMLDKDKYYHYLEDFGLGNLTNTDLQEESTPPFRKKENWYEIDYATSSFGQGIAVTPLQMIRAVSVIANGGKLMEPHFVKNIRLPNGDLIDIPPKMIKTVIKPETAKIVTEMMVNSVDNGEAKFAKPVGYRIAGKTGTAQIPISGHYDANKTIASFVGFAPADKPKFIMLVALREPSTSQWGSETAAPLFFSIAKDLFPYFNISPTD